MKKIINIGFLLLSCLLAKAQLAEQYSLYTENHYLVNPAAAGYKEYVDVNIGFRKQWAGAANSPRTFYASAHSILRRTITSERSALRISSSKNEKTLQTLSEPKVNHALGARINSSEFGAFSKNEFMLTYAIHLPLYKKTILSFGLSAGLSNFGFDENKATVLDIGDPTYNAYASGSNSNKLNVNSGVYLHNEHFFIGYSANQLLQNDLDVENEDIALGDNKMLIQHYVMGGYHFILSNDFKLTPTVLLKQINPNPMSYELNLTLNYQNHINFGIGYRSEDAVAALLGLQINHLLRVGYAYDYTLSDIKQSSNGSHELFIGLTLF